VFRAGSDPANQILVLRWVFGNRLQEALVGPQGFSFAQSLKLHRPVVLPVGLYGLGKTVQTWHSIGILPATPD
jgi:hypothetical protein